MKHQSLFTLLVMAIIALTAVSASAGLVSEYGILDLTANGGINPNTGAAWQAGDQYRLALHTADTTISTSNDPEFYNAFVTAQAEQNTALVGSQWFALVTVNLDGSMLQADSPKSDPRVVSGTDDQTGGSAQGGAGVPVYAMDGSTCIARNNADIWNRFSNPFESAPGVVVADGTGDNQQRLSGLYYTPFLDQNVAQTVTPDANHGKDIITGTNYNGTHQNALGSTTGDSDVRANGGNTNANNNSRTWNRWQTNLTNGRSLYAISEPLSVIDPTAFRLRYPGDGDVVDPGPVTLVWKNMDPNTTPRTEIYVDVLFGTDPENLALLDGSEYTSQAISGVADVNDVALNSLDPGIYFWQVISYPHGDPALVDYSDPATEPNAVTTSVFSFSNDKQIDSVELIAPNQITWRGQPVQLDGIVDDDEATALSYLWTGDPSVGTVFSAVDIINPTVTLDPPKVVVRGVQSNDDDAEQYINSEAISGRVQGEMKFLTDSDLELGSETDSASPGLDWQVIAVQFDQLGIPQGAIITSAKITFEVQNSGVSDPGSSNDFTILAEAIDDAAVFTEDPNNITDRARTTASASWAPDGLPVAGTKIDTPDLTELIKEVVDREGWSADNRLTLMIYPDVYLASPTGGTTMVQEIEFEAGPGADAPTLTVAYEWPGDISPNPTTVTITLAVNDESNPAVKDTVTIDVYDNACMAARVGRGLDVATDYHGDCITGVNDLATMAAAWLDDVSATQAYVGVVPSTKVSTMIATTETSRDSWNDPTNWDAGVPEGDIGAVIPDGFATMTQSSDTPAFTGSLSIGIGSTLSIGYTTGNAADFNLINLPSSITMNDGSSIVLRTNPQATFGTVYLAGDALINLCPSTSAHHTTRVFDGSIVGPGSLSLIGNNNQTGKLNVANSFSGGLIADAADNWRVEANAAGSLGAGDVTINGRTNNDPLKGVSLVVNAADAMNPKATLYLNGGRDSKKPYNKLVLNQDLIVAECVVNGTPLAVNLVGYDSTSGLTDESGTVNLLSGSGKLIVTGPDASLPDVTVSAGTKIITASGFEFDTDPNAINDSGAEATYAWTDDAPAGITVSYDDDAALAPKVTITKDADTEAVDVITLTLSVTVAGNANAVTSSVTVDVYDNGCALVLDKDLSAILQTDHVVDCITNLGDLAVLAAAWLDDYSLTEPQPRL